MKAPKTLDRNQVLKVLHQLQKDVSDMRQEAFDVAMQSLKVKPMDIAESTMLFGVKNGIADTQYLVDKMVTTIEYLDIS